MDLTGSTRSPSRWTPIRLGWDGPRPAVDWCLTEGVPFTAPFFDQTVEECFRHPCRVLFRRETGMEEVGRFVAESPGLPPAAFIFHMSRCGSTMVSQMLAALPEHLVLSEAAPIDSVLRANWSRRQTTDDERSTWLRWMVGALGQPRDDCQQRLFVKFDAWSVIDLPLVRRTFPHVPWLFFYRDPVEVLVSHSRRLGAHVIPGVLPPGLVGMAPTDVAEIPPVEYRARVLARICEAALDRSDDPLATFVDYGQLPGFVLWDLPGICSASFDQSDADRMLDAAGRDAKNPAIPFEDDRAGKQSDASPALRAAAERWLAPLYERLEEARAAQETRREAAHAR